jgi:hypothetical protein
MLCGALNDGLRQYGGSDVVINTNVGLEELFEIMNNQAFGPLLSNNNTIVINGSEIDVESLRNVVAWYTEAKSH